MKHQRSYPPLGTSPLLPVTAGALAVAIFLVDAMTPLDMAVAVLYVAVVLMAANFLDRRAVLLACLGCLALTVLAYLIGHGLTVTTALGRGLVSVSAIVITTFLALKHQSAILGLRERARLLDLTHDTIFARDLNDVVTYWNRGAEDLYGWRSDEAIGRVAHQLLQTIFPAPLEEITAALLRNGRWEGEIVHATRDRRQLVVASRWTLERDDRGRPVAVLETNNDITDRKEAEQRIRKAERELRLTIDTIQILAWHARPDGFVEYLNKRWLDYTGLALEEALGWRWQIAVHSDDRAALVDTWRAIVAAGVPGEVEARLRRFDGEYRWFRFGCEPFRDDRGELVGWYGTSTDIEDRKRADERLRQAERELRTTIDTIPALVVGAWSDGTPDFFNARWVEQGFSEEALRRGLSGIVHPDDLAEFTEKRSRSLATGEPYQAEVRLRRANGEARWYLIRVVTLRDETGRVVKRYSTSTDIEDRKRAEERLRRAERELRTTIDTVPAVVMSAEPDGTLDFINARWAEQGFSEEALLSDWSALVHPNDVAEFVARRQRSIETGDPYEVEARFRRIDGEYRWLLMRAVSLRDETGQVVKRYATATDIENRKRAEEKLRRAERELRTTIDTIPVGVVSFGRDGTPEFYNQAWRTYTGLSPEELKAHPWRVTVHADEAAAVEREWRVHLATGQPFEMEQRERRADGDYRWHLVKRVPLRDEKGEVIRWYGAGYDIDDQKRAEVALRRSEALLAETQELSHTGSVGFDAATGEVFWSAEGARIFGYDPSTEPTLELLVQRVHPDDVWLARRSIERTNRGEPDSEFDIRLLMPHGTVKYVHAVSHAARDAEARRALRALIDVTAAREAETALHRAQAELAHVTRMTALGELTASIAHEVNQPLAAIVTNGQACLRWLGRELPDLDEARDAVTRVIGDADRASEVIRRIRALAKKSEPQQARLDLNGVIEDVIVLVRREVQSHRVSLRLDLAQDLPLVVGDRVQLQQVIINLLINAFQAMATVTDRPRELLLRSHPHKACQVLVVVQDSGIGIDPADVGRLFETFFTTKPEGVGMGLSICRSIIEAHGGEVWASPNVGSGATFQFTLPSIRESVASPVDLL